MVLIIDDILIIPFSLGFDILQAIAEKADEELLNTEKSIRDQILKTQNSYENGEISGEKYQMEMKKLRRRLNIVKGEEHGNRECGNKKSKIH